MDRKIFFVVTLFFFSHTSRAVEKHDMIVGRSMGSDSRYATHMTPLITAVMNTKGPILELGCGDFSTPLLHAICAATDRFLLTAESNKEWQKLFYDLERDWHQFYYVQTRDDWANVGSNIHWSVVFVDHAPGLQRVIDICRLRFNTDIFVVHDTEDPFYGYDPVFATFKYVFTYRRYAVTTTLVSNTIDVSKFFE